MTYKMEESVELWNAYSFVWLKLMRISTKKKKSAHDHHTKLYWVSAQPNSNIDRLHHKTILHVKFVYITTWMWHIIWVRFQACVNCMTLKYQPVNRVTCGCYFFFCCSFLTKIIERAVAMSFWRLTTKLPGNLLEMELATWFTWFRSISILFEYVHFVGRFLIIKRWF